YLNGYNIAAVRYPKIKIPITYSSPGCKEDCCKFKIDSSPAEDAAQGYIKPKLIADMALKLISEVPVPFLTITISAGDKDRKPGNTDAGIPISLIDSLEANAKLPGKGPRNQANFESVFGQ
ncbi:hypothetical protein MMC31_006962, partial [Peltigera leucophlebia]|nr:hypothetical protein [Peltigera leucophlebia]